VKKIDSSELAIALERIGKLEDAVALMIQLFILNRPPLNKNAQYLAVLESLKELTK
jgi:hypothetical protein